MSKATREVMEALHSALARTLADRIGSGEATAADLAVARQFLKDNGVDAIPTQSNDIGKLANLLPFQQAVEREDDRDCV